MRRRGSIRVVLFVVSILLLLNIFQLNAEEARSSGNNGNDPFYLIGDNETLIAHYHIQGDAELIQFVEDHGAGGSGTSVDPYNVSGLYVPVDTGEQCGLLIENTTLHVSFNDLEIEQGSYYSMIISNCSNIFFISLTTHDLLIESSSNITVIDITLMLGVYIYDSQGIDIRENTAYLYFAFYNSQDIRIRNNNCTLSSMGFYFANCMDVDIENNTFKSTRYYLLITANCNKILVRNNTFLGDKNGLYLSGDSSSVCRITGNIFRSYNDACIWISSGNCHIYDNLFDENRKGIHIRFDSNSSITGNIFSNNYNSSLDFYRGWDTLSKHTINNNSFYCNRGSSDSYDAEKRQIPDLVEQAGYYQFNVDGNFWYDWCYLDHNGDGIVDEPYIIGPDDSYEKDNYPLVRSPHVPEPPEITNIEQLKYFIKFGYSIRLHWTPAPDGFISTESYNVYMMEPGDKEYDHLEQYSQPNNDFCLGTMEGLHLFRITSSNMLGESDPSDAVEITLVGDRPELSIITPENGSYLNDLGSIIALQVHDNESSDKLQILIKLDDSSWKIFDINNYYYNSIFDLFYFFSIEPEDGEHTISVRVTDPGGNVVERSTTFILDRSEPMINFTSPEPGEYSIEKEVEVTWEIISESIGSIHFRLEDGYNGLTGWIELPNLEQRSMKLHINKTTTFYLMVEDLAGNVEYAYKNLGYDGTPPYLSIPPVQFCGTSSYYINYENNDDESGIENNYLSFDGISWKEIGRERSYKLEDLVENRYEIFIRSVNYAGLSATVSFELIVDLTPPVITSITPISGGYYNRELTRITWNVYDNMTGVSGASIEYNDDNKITIDPNVRSYDIPYLLGGENRFKLHIHNGVGLSVVKEVVFYTDYKKPTIEWRYPIGEIEEWNGTIHVKFSEEIIPSTLSIYIDDVDNTMFGEIIWFNNDALLFIPTFLPMDNIDHSIKVTGTDISGNEISDYKWFFINVNSIGAVTGRILDEDGKPIKGVVIYIDEEIYFLDDNASFSFPLCDGLHRVEIRKEGFTTLHMDFNISNGVDKNLGDLELRYEEVDLILSPINIIIAAILLIVLITVLIFFIFRRRRYFNEFNIPLSPNSKVREVRKSIREVDPDKEGNFYDFLSIDRGSSVKEIKLAYRKKAVLYHPDGLSGISPERREHAQENMKKLNMIRDILTEPVTRAIYDNEISHRHRNK